MQPFKADAEGDWTPEQNGKTITARLETVSITHTILLISVVSFTAQALIPWIKPTI